MECYDDVIIVAAGKSKRMGKDKIFLELSGKPMIYYAIKPFETHENIKSIVIVTSHENKKPLESLIEKYGFKCHTEYIDEEKGICRITIEKVRENDA